MCYSSHRRFPAVLIAALLLGLFLALPAPAVRATAILVNTTADTIDPCATTGTGTCSLRDVVALANATVSATNNFMIAFDTTAFPPGTPETILLKGGTLTLTGKSGVTMIDGTGHQVVVDGGKVAGVFTVNSGVTATLTGLTIQHGNTLHGGGINNSGTLTVTNSTFTDNAATLNGGGGGIWNSGTLTLTNSTLSGNATSGTGSGGGIVNVGMLTLTNSTFTGNSAFSGGGIANVGTLAVTNSTLAGNTAGIGGGILNTGTATLSNTLVADNPTGGDLSGAFTGSHNLVDDAANAGGFTDGVNGNLVGHAALLGTLGSFGGATPTVSLLPGSPAIDAGSCAPGYHDQRGIATVGTACDIGAVESQGFTLAPVGGTPQSTAVNTTFAPLVVGVTAKGAGEPVQGGQVTFIAPTSGASAALSTTTAPITGGSMASVSATANGTAGAYSVIASAPGASSAAFALANTPVLSGISPASGVTVGGNHVTLTGRGFGTSTTNVAVSIGGVTAAAVSIGDTTLVVTAPAHAAGAVDVVVTVNGERVTAAGGYTYGVVSTLPNPHPSGGTGGNPAPEPGARARAVPAGNANPLPPPRP